jgi:hypothetical protein
VPFVQLSIKPVARHHGATQLVARRDVSPAFVDDRYVIGLDRAQCDHGQFAVVVRALRVPRAELLEEQTFG